MKESKFRISNYAYDVLCRMQPGDRNIIIKELIPEHIKIGYGLYGQSVRLIDGEPYVVYTHGDSCD